MTTTTELTRRRREIAKEMARTGFALPGTIVEQMRRCSTPGCRCHADPEHLHGPYLLWTGKVAGKTVTRILTEDQRARYSS